MKEKAEEYQASYAENNERYTSQACGNCGKLKKDLGANKVYECDSCGFIYDRDLNGARGIMIKYLTEKAVPKNTFVS